MRTLLFAEERFLLVGCIVTIHRRTVLVALVLTILVVLISRLGLGMFEMQDPLASDPEDAAHEDAAYEDAASTWAR